MSSAAASADQAAGWVRNRLPQLVLARFISRRSILSGGLLGLVFGFYVYDNAIAFDTIAPTMAKRNSLLISMAGNTGLKALLGEARQVTTRAGFTDWRALGVTSLVASIWGLVVATKAFRGEEEAGRWELFLAGRTTSRRAAANALAGLGVGVLAMYLLTTLLTALVSTRHEAGISPGRSLLFALAVVAGAAMFATVGTVASQLMPTRGRAVGAAAVVFGVAFLLRALGDSASSAHWLVYLSPLGWLEQLHPLTDTQPIWLIPVFGLVAAGGMATVLLAGRDLGASVLKDETTAEPRMAMLGSSAGLALRLSLASTATWLTASVVAGLLYGSLAKSAGRAFASSGMLRRFTGSLTHAAVRQLQLAGTRAFAGMIFLIMMTLIMVYVASAISRVREDEAEGYLENLVVRSVSRQRWLLERSWLILTVLVAAGVAGGIAFWVTTASQHAGLTFVQLLQAGVNSAAPAAVLLGIGVLTLGFAPRLTSVVCWAVLAWAFLLDLLGSAIKLNHWLMDTSLLYHPALAPAVNPDWRIAGIYLVIGCAAALVGGWRFTQRDLQGS